MQFRGRSISSIALFIASFIYGHLCGSPGHIVSTVEASLYPDGTEIVETDMFVLQKVPFRDDSPPTPRLSFKHEQARRLSTYDEDEDTSSDATPSPDTLKATPTPQDNESTTSDTKPVEPELEPSTSPPSLSPVEEVTAEPSPSPVVEERTPSPSTEKEPNSEPTLESSVAPDTPAPTEAVVPVEETSPPMSDEQNKVATPYFGDATSEIFISSVTFHILCDTEGAMIHYTLDGTSPDASSPEKLPGAPISVQRIGTFTVTAIGVKEGMENSDEASKTVTVEDTVAAPEFVFEGEKASGARGNSFLRAVTITMNCETPNATIFYTTDDSEPGEQSTAVIPGTELRWAEEGNTTFKAIAMADDDTYKSGVQQWDVLIVAPRIDQHPMAPAALEDVDDMHPQIDAVAFRSVYIAPGESLEQEEQLGPGYGEECSEGDRIVRGKLLRLANPKSHFAFIPPKGTGLALASVTEREFEPERSPAVLMEGESAEDARVRLKLDEREDAWQAARNLSCQAAAGAELLGALDREGDSVNGPYGHLVSNGQVLRVQDNTNLVSFGVRDGHFVVGVVSAEEVRNNTFPFQNLISGAGWLVRAGANHVDASARDGHLDELRSQDGGDDDPDSLEQGEGLDDILAAKLARTAIGHDAEGRLILLQTSGAAAGADQDSIVPDGLNLYELADVLVEAGAVNAVNLAGGGPAAMTVNHSAVVDPSGSCDYQESGLFPNDSSLARCEQAVRSIVCVHLDPPPFIVMEATPAPSTFGSPWGQHGSSSGGGHGSEWSYSSDDWTGENDEDATRVQWQNELCGNGTTGNSTGLWDHLDDIEEAVLRYKVAFWVTAILGTISLYFNIQSRRTSSTFGGSQAGNGIGTINMKGIGSRGTLQNGVELNEVGRGKGHRESRSAKTRRKSVASGGYARVNDGDGSVHGGLMGTTGFYGEDSDEEEIDLRQAPPSRSSSRKKDKSKGGRLRRTLAKVAGNGDNSYAQPPAPADAQIDSDADRPFNSSINPFGGGRGMRGGYDEEGTWA